MRRFLLASLIVLTSLSSYILYKSLTGNIAFSLIFTAVSIAGYTNGMWVDSSYGFEGISQAISRYNLGVFTPLLLLLFLKFFRSARMAILFFFLVGLGVNLHPPVAINMAIVTGILVFIKKGLNRQTLSWMIIYALVFLIGSLPFTLSFQDAILTRGVTEVSISAKDFYGEGLVHYTTLFLSSPLRTMLYGLLFPPFISYLVITVLSISYIKLQSKQIPQKSDLFRTLNILNYGVITSFCLFFINESLIGILLPRLIGPHAFSLHRVARVFFLFSQTSLLLIAWIFWSGDIIEKRSRIISSIIIINVLMGFNWISYAGRVKHLTGLISEESAYFVCSSIFLIFIIILTISYYRTGIRNKFYLLILTVTVITLPNIIFIGSDLIIRVFPVGSFGKTYIDVKQKKIDRFYDMKELVRWAKSRSKPSDLFLFVTDDETDSYYFKTRAIRSTFYSFDEITHYFPLRKIKYYTQQLKILDSDIRTSINRNDMEMLRKIIRDNSIDHIVLVRSESASLENSKIPLEFINETFIVFHAEDIINESYDEHI